ncbi:RNase A-like domain-containing protein [Pseudomonas spelaei]
MPNPTGWVDPKGLSCKQSNYPEGPYGVIVPGGGLYAHESAGGHLIKKYVGRTDEQLAERLKQEPNVPTASTFPDRATAESIVLKVLSDNKAKINKFLKVDQKKLVITQKTQEPVGVSLKRGLQKTVPRKEIHLIIQRDKKMPDGYRILTGYPNP